MLHELVDRVVDATLWRDPRHAHRGSAQQAARPMLREHGAQCCAHALAAPSLDACFEHVDGVCG